jgi:CRP/FNR family transcriptional regulator, cyclic AMP receptor protein
MGIRETVAQLAEVPIFSGCSRKELEVIAKSAKEIHHREGAVLSREGEPGIGLFLIVDGTAKVTIGGVEKGRMDRRAFFGEVALLDRGPRSATVTAVTPMTVLVLTEWVFRGLVRAHPGIAVKTLEAVASRFREATAAATL